MAKSITKVSDKLAKAGDVVNVYYYDNGFMCEVSGRDSEDDWKTVKLNCKDLTEVQKVLEEVNSLPRE